MKWIEYQNDASFQYEDHVKIAKKRDQAQYPFEITSNRGHLLISREAFEQWERKFEREELNEKEMREIDPEKFELKDISGELLMSKSWMIYNQRLNLVGLK